MGPVRCCALAVLLAGVLTAGVSAAHSDESPPGEPWMAPDVQDVLFLGPARPVLFRLRLQTDGRPASDRWETFLRRLFDFLDRDGDGLLDEDEAARAPSAWQVLQLFQGNVYLSAMGPSPSSLDAGGGKLTFAEFRAFYRKHDAGPVGLAPALGAFDPFATLDEALFAALDTDGDGRLSRPELAAAPHLLRTLDRNDDEMIDPGELVPNGPPAPARVWGPAAPGPSLVLIQREDAPGQLRQRLRAVRDLMARYDSDGDGKLDRRECRLPRAMFERLDRNEDGRLDVLELLHYVVGPPDAEAVLQLPSPGAAPGSGPAVEGGAPLRRDDERTLTLPAQDMVVHLVGLPASFAAGGGRPAARGFYFRLLEAADTDRRGYVTRSQLAGPNAPFLTFAFELGDRDGDGRLTRAEVVAVADLLTSAVGAQTQVALGHGGRGLFRLLDADGDGRLSVRELRSAAARLRPFERGGFVARGATPELYRLVVSQGPPDYRVAPALRGPFAGPVLPPRARRGPVWFRKMDRNGDGDVSPREFLGTSEQFRRLDLDGDGLISVEEAEKADALLRKPRR
jgi:Ca2+-binding EF-hand superfamily protein